MSSSDLKRQFTLPDKYQKVIEKALKTYGLKLSQSKQLAKQIKKASDFYTSESHTQSPWNDPMFAASYLVYFFPLNYLRLRAVFEEGHKLKFYDGITDFVDFGSGTGTAQFALLDTLLNEDNVKTGDSDISFTCVETSKQAIDAHKQMLEDIFPQAHTHWKKQMHGPHEDDHLICSYSLNELEQTPDWIYKYSSMTIVDPSTQKMGRKLLELRKKLSEKKYSHWAPCVHQGDCPLLSQSKKDWCHDRIFTELPDWWKEIEKHLPMKNDSITFSYLLSRNDKEITHAKNTARIIGDTLNEKGKSKQMMCRGSHREFLAWLTKRVELQHIPRGSRVLMPEDIEPKANELRMKEDISIL